MTQDAQAATETPEEPPPPTQAETVIGSLRGNTLNDLTAKQYAAYLRVADLMPRSSQDDVAYSVKTGSIPQSAMSDTVAFFTKENARVLDVFSGNGRMLTTCSHSGRKAVGIDIDTSLRKEYREQLQNDMFGDEQPYHCGDAVDTIKALDPEPFDFVFLDPPRARSCLRNSESIGHLKIPEYIQYLVDCMAAAARVLKPTKFLAVHLDLVFDGGRLNDIPGALALHALAVPNLRQRLFKVWYYDKTTHLGNLGVVAPNINTAHMLAFERTQ